MGSVSCSRVASECSDGILAPSPLISTPSMVCLHLGSNRDPSTSQPSFQQTASTALLVVHFPNVDSENDIEIVLYCLGDMQLHYYLLRKDK